MHTVTFYSYKGGVGRTLVVANVAKYVARLGMKVFVLDFDLEAPGIHYKFEGEGGSQLRVERGLVDILSTFTTTRRLPAQLTDYVLQVPSPPFATGTIHVLPAGDAPSAAYWKALSKVDWHTLFYSEEADGIPLFLELKAFIEDTYAPDFVLIDARTGITEMGGVATTVLSDQVVCLMLPTSEHLDGTRQVMHAIRSAPRLEGAREINLLAALSRMPHKDVADEMAEVERVKNFLNTPVGELGASLGLDDVPVLHRDPALEEREQVLVGSGKSLDDSRLLQDYVRLFIKLVPPGEIARSVRPLIADIEKRIMQAPDEAEQALEALAKDCLHPEAYHALLRMYRARRSPLSKRLSAAQAFWRITDDASEPLLWDAIKDYEHDPDEDTHDLGRLQAIEAIWRAHAPEDARLAFHLALDHESANRTPQALGVLEANVSTGGASAAVVARFIKLLCKCDKQDVADRVIVQHKDRMATAPRFLQAWAERVLLGNSYEALRALLDDACFNQQIIEKSVPALGARLHFFRTRDESSANAFLVNARLTGKSGSPKHDLAHLGALAREIGEWDAFMSRLAKVFPHSAMAIVGQIDEMPPLPEEMSPPTEEEIPF